MAPKIGAIIYNHHVGNNDDDVTKQRRRRLLPFQQHSTRILFDTRGMPMRRTPMRRTRTRKTLMRRRGNDVAMTTKTGGVRTTSKVAWSLLLFTLTYVVNVILINHKPVLFVGADSMVESMREDGHVNDIEIDKPINTDLDKETTNGDNKHDAEEDVTSAPPLPASLMKATRVGAKIREVVTSGKQKQTLDDDDDDDDYNEAEAMTLNLNDDDGGSDVESNKPPPTGCGWGTVGCKKGSKRQAGEVMNASSIVEDFPSGDDGDDVTLPPASSLAGSATAKIKARVTKKKKGGHHPVYDRDTTTTTINVEPNTIKSPKKEALHHGATAGDNKPPHGFQLAGRVVTSPTDGLSYFLDAPKVTPTDQQGSWMMSIPYAYLECGPTIESTTEAFLLGSMVLRHFPASASMSHWTNLGGGVTIEEDGNDDGNNGVGEGGVGEGKMKGSGSVIGGGGSSRYIEGSRESYPKLIVPLSPIEITVSGNDEETRIFNPGDVILMEDTLGKGHKMKAATTTTTSGGGDNKDGSQTRDLSVLMVSLPHEVHFPMNDWVEESSSSSSSRSSSEDDDVDEFTLSTMRHSASSSSSSSSSSSPPTPSSYDDAHHALYGFAPKHLHSKHHRRKFNKKQRSPSSFAANAKKPCPLEYDSAYSSLFMPAHDQYHKHYRHHRHHRRNNPQWGGVTTNTHNNKDSSSFNEESYPPPPGYTTYKHTAQVFDTILPSLRRTMLFGLGLSLSSSFIYCVQLLYPPLLVLWGGATLVVAGALVNVLVTRWGYRNWIADRVEEWRWKREVRRMRRMEVVRKESESEEFMEDVVLEGEVVEGEVLENNGDDHEEESANDHVEDETGVGMETEA